MTSKQKKTLSREDFVKWGREGIARILSNKTAEEKSEYMKKVRRGGSTKESSPNT